MTSRTNAGRQLRAVRLLFTLLWRHAPTQAVSFGQFAPVLAAIQNEYDRALRAQHREDSEVRIPFLLLLLLLSPFILLLLCTFILLRP
jgi:hypothetical protein